MMVAVLMDLAIHNAAAAWMRCWLVCAAYNCISLKGGGGGGDKEIYIQAGITVLSPAQLGS